MPLRSPERYSRSRRLAMMPSRVAPTRSSQPLASAEPGGRRREADAGGAAQVFFGKRLELAPPHLQRLIDVRFAVGSDQEVEHDQQRRRLRRQPLHPALRGMDALQQGVEGERAVERDDDLAVEHEGLGLDAKNGLDQLGIIAGQRLARLRLQLDLVVIAKHQATKAVPFRLVLPFVAGRDLVDRQSFHRREWRTKRQSHDRFCARAANANGRHRGRPFARRRQRRAASDRRGDPLLELLLRVRRRPDATPSGRP